MDVSSFTVLLPAGAGVPEWVHLIPAGKFSDSSGRTYVLRDAQKVIEASMTGGKLPLDENHSTQRAPAFGASSPAMGWIVELQSRADGIWARVDWNESGTKMMTDRAYKNISPVFGHEEDGTVTVIHSAALTNNPGLKQLTALLTQPNQGTTMDKVAICMALGLPESADEKAVLVALQTARANGTALQTANAEKERLAADLATLKATMVPAERLIAMQTEVDAMKAAQSKAAAIAFIDGAIKDGKPIAALREELIAQHTANPAATEAMVKKLPTIHTGGTRSTGTARVVMQDAMDGDELTAEETAICTAMGTDPAKYKAMKKAMAGKQGSAA